MRKFERVSYAPEDTILPTRATSNSAGYDFYSSEAVVIEPHCSHIFKTGVKVQVPTDEYLAIHVRSSVGIKKGLNLLNGTGIIDADFYNNEDNEGNICIGVYNRTETSVKIDKGERIAQGIFCKYFITDGDKPLSDVRKGGVGSSGK